MHHLAILGLTLWLTSFVLADSPTFSIDVQAVLSKSGCNLGTCHGNQNGKGGLKLSLRGQNPQLDYAAIVQQHGGRRVNLLDPSQSLILQKPTGELTHQGGQRFPQSDPLYQILRDWLNAGASPPNDKVTATRLVVSPMETICFAPKEEVQLRVDAHYSDGSQRNVTDLAVYESSNLNVDISPAGLVQRAALGEATVIVRYLQLQVPVRVAFLDARDEFVWQHRRPRNYIDEFAFEKLKKFRTNPAQDCADHVFLRRAYLDTLGILPTATESRQFVQDASPAKREALIDNLLARPEFADNWALKWADLLRAEEKVLDTKGVQVFHAWIRDSIASGKSLNEFAAELLAARGSTYDNPPANYYRALRETNQRGEAAARVFLGTRLQCAQCHNHPFDRWTQDDYYSWAALFAGIDYKIVSNKPTDKLDKNQFVGEQIVQVKAAGDVRNPTSEEVMSPRFLGEQQQLSDDDDRLRALAAWLSSPDNRQFARAQVNRLWYHLMGAGLVEPVDDFRVTNPASHPQLLERLTDDFIASGCDIRQILRLVMRSTIYQLDSESAQSGDQYARVEPRRLSAEQLLDAQAQSLAATVLFNGHPLGSRAGALPGVHRVNFRKKRPSPGDRFLFSFGKPERLMTCECERSDATTLSQALLLVNGECMDDILTQHDNRIGKLLDAGSSLDEVIGELYWSTLSRAPSDTERHHAHSVIGRSPGKRQGLEDIAWALLNAKEFVFRQ